MRAHSHISPPTISPRHIALLSVVAILACAPCAAGQSAGDPAPRLELWGAVSASLGGSSGSLTSSYSPPLLFDGSFTSTGTQTVTFESSASAGFQAGANVFFSPHAGIQLFVDRVATDLSGVNTPYDVTLQYTTLPPPNYQPQMVNVQQSTPWPDTAGSLAQWTMAVNGVARMGRPDHVSVTLSGGLSYYRLEGTVEPIAYTTFRLGGRSVLFQDDFRVAVALEPTNAFGFNGGGDVNIAVHKNAAFVIGYRYVGGPTVDVPVRVDAIVNADQIINLQTIAEIAQRLALAPARVGVSGSRLVVGFKVLR